MVEMHGKKKPKVLMVENNPVMRETLQRFLRTKFPDVDVHQAGDGREAFAQIHDSLPDLILMDINLPGENGLMLTRKLSDLYPQVIIIVLTNYDQPEYRKAAIENGARYFLSKSELHTEKLATVVESILIGTV
jgi:DNA-binding NarL/FixJ family response regulator